MEWVMHSMPDMDTKGDCPMRTSVFLSALLALPGSFLTPPAVAYASPSPADSAHFCQILDPEEWERERASLPAAKRTGLSAGESRTVRLFYFLPNDRRYRPEVVEAMKTGILEVQSFYGNQMAAHGYANKTFQLETDAQGVPVVHRVDGDHSESHYKSKTQARPGDEIRRAFDTRSIVQLIVMDISRSSSSAGIGIGIKERGMGIVYGGWRWFIAAHELGHAFGLAHDFRDDAYIMSYGYNQTSLSAGAASFLSVNPYFNSNVPLAAGGPPSVELTSSTAYSYGQTSVEVRFMVRDPDGLHQASLLVHTPTGLFIPAGFTEVKAWDELNGGTAITVRFDFDGKAPSDENWSLSDLIQHTIYVSAVDKKGDRISAFQPDRFTLRAVNIPALNVPLRERSLGARKSIFNVVRIFHDRHVHNYEEVTAAHLANLRSLIVKRIRVRPPPAIFESLHGTYPWTDLKSDDFDGLTGLRGLELGFKDGYSDNTPLPAGIFEGLTSLVNLRIKWSTDTYGSDPSFLPFLPLTVGLQRVGEGQFKAVMPTGAPGDIDLPLVVVNGSINAGAESVTIPAGSVESDVLTVTRTPGTTAAVIVDLGRILPDATVPGFYFYRSTFHLELFSPLAGAPTPVAERTPKVIEAIVGVVPEIDHSHHDRDLRYMVNGKFIDKKYNMGHYVSEAHLKAITSLDVSGSSGGGLSLGGNWFSLQGNIKELKPGDFDGMTNLTDLRLNGNELSALPENIIDQLTNLKDLSLNSNELTSLPDGVFDQLTNLTELGLGSNELTSLPSGLFDQLTNLTVLGLNGNELTSLPSGLFDNLINLTRLYLNSNQLSALPDGLFGSLTNLTLLNLWDNPVSSLQESDFDHLTDLEVLILPSNSNPSNPLEFSGDTPVSDRTPRVRDAIVAAAGVSSASDVTEAQLAAITLLDLTGQNITDLKPGDFDNLTNLESLGLGDNQLSALPEDLFEYLISLKGLDLRDNQLSSMPDGLFNRSTNLTALVLSGNQLSSLPAKLLDRTSRLTLLDLSDNELSSLPAELFDHISDLTILSLNNNQLSSLPRGLFNKVTAWLDLSDNQLSSLPDGLFEGIFDAPPDLTGFEVFGIPVGPTTEKITGRLDLTSNPGAPLPLTVSLEKVAAGQFKAVAPAGAPFDMVLPLQVGSGTIDGGATTITIPAGRLESDTLTVTRTSGVTFTVTMDIGTLPELPEGQGGYALLKSANLPLAFPEFGGVTSVCERTRQVRDEIVAAASVSACSDITEAQLAAITGLFLSGQNITDLKPGDFHGLTGLTKLALSETQLSSLPEGLFDQLTNLRGLQLYDTQLTSLPEDLFDQLSNLSYLELADTQLTSLPEGIFDELTNLNDLYLSDNQLALLPAGIFGQLTSLNTLWLDGNQLASLPEDLFDQLSNLGDLDLSENQLAWLHGGTFDGLPLSKLDLRANQLNSLPDKIFAQITSLGKLQLEGNAIDPLVLRISLERVAEGQFKAVAPSGAPFDIVLPLTIANGTIDGGATTLTIPVGSVESGTLTVTLTPGTTSAVTVDIGTLPGPPGSHSGYGLSKSADLPLEVISGTTAATDFNGDGQTDFADFFLLLDAFGGTDSRFDLDGSGTVDFVDFFQFLDAFDQSGQAKLVALAQELIGLPSETDLQQNAPNPFNSETVISWFLLEPGLARVEVFALTGQRVAVLAPGAAAGRLPPRPLGRPRRCRPRPGQRGVPLPAGERRPRPDAQTHPAEMRESPGDEPNPQPVPDPSGGLIHEIQNDRAEPTTAGLLTQSHLLFGGQMARLAQAGLRRTGADRCRPSYPAATPGRWWRTCPTAGVRDPCPFSARSGIRFNPFAII